MARRKSDQSSPPPEAEADLMAVVEATDPQIADSEKAETAQMSVSPPETPPTPGPTPSHATALTKGSSATGAFVGMVLGGIIAAGGGFALARLMPDLLPLSGTADLSARMEAQAEEIAALRQQLAALPEKPSPDPAFEARLAALEQAAPVDAATLDARLAALESRIETLPATVDPASPAVLAELAALKQQVAALGAGGTVPADVLAAAEAAETRLREAESRAADLARQAEATAAEARRAAARDRIAAALDSGAPFAAALADLGETAPPALAEAAATGLPTLAELEEGLATAARLSLEQALRANMGESWTERVSNFLRSQTGLRSLSPREGDDPDAVLSRAEAALRDGRLGDALVELEAMAPAGKPALEPWIAEARIRLAAEAALADLAKN